MKIGIQQLLIILVLALVIFGGGKLAGVGKALGTSIKDFKKEMKDVKDDNKPAEQTADAAAAPVQNTEEHKEV